MSLYPSLEDMKVDQAFQAQEKRDRKLAIQLQQEEQMRQRSNHQQRHKHGDPRGRSSRMFEFLYPSLTENSPPDIDSHYRHQPSVSAQSSQQITSPLSQQTLSYTRSPSPQKTSLSSRTKFDRPTTQTIAPYSNHGILGLKRAEIRQGIRSIVLCKDGVGKLGLRIKAVNKGVFVAFVNKDSPASMGGLRFGDQILQINGETLAGYSSRKVMKSLKKCDPTKIELAIRDRPFERTVTLQKDGSGHIGIVFKKGKVTALIKHSSAARNGLLVGEHLCEVNGQCVVGMKDQNLEELILNCGKTVTVTMMPALVFSHMIKKMGNGLLKNQDRSIPEI